MSEQPKDAEGPVHPLTVSEIERLLIANLSVETEDETAGLHGITEAATAIADRILEIFQRYGRAAPDMLGGGERSARGTERPHRSSEQGWPAYSRFQRHRCLARRHRQSRGARAMKPLHGEKTHPLSAHALAELREMLRAPEPRCGVNPGVADRLLREALVESVDLPSPFPTHKGRRIEHLRITDAGRAAIAKATGA
jgi:hypothetical protein